MAKYDASSDYTRRVLCAIQDALKEIIKIQYHQASNVSRNLEGNKTVDR